MKSERPYDRRQAASLPFIELFSEGDRDLAWDFSSTREGSRPRKKIFIIKQTGRLPSTSTSGGKIQRILIFDNHPDSLRLVHERRGRDVDIDLLAPPRDNWLEIMLVSVAAGAVLGGVLWSLFEMFLA